MINNDALERALGTLERYAPAEDEVLAGMRSGITRRRRRRQVASVVAVAGTAAAVALGVVYVAPTRGADHTGFIGAAPPTTSVTKIPPPAPALPFTVGWVPDGYQLEVWEAGGTDGSAQYVGSKDFQTVVVWVSGAPREAAAQGDTEVATTIAGRPGTIRRLTPDGKETQLLWQLADGRWAMVGGRAPAVSLATLQHVAESLSVTPVPMSVPFSLTTLPEGYAGVTWMGGTGGPMLGSLTICRGAVVPRTGGQPADCINVNVGEGTAPAKLVIKSTKDSGMVEIPIDQERTTDGVLTRATADGTTVVAQLDAGHWVQAMSKGAGVDLLRQVVAAIRS